VSVTVEPDPRWETFRHDADIGVRGWGSSRERSFEGAALGLTGVITDPRVVQPSQRIEIQCSGPDDELLFYAWMNAVVTEMALRRMLFSRFEVTIEGQELRASLWGEPVDVARHDPAVEVKGATFTELCVRELEERSWMAQCVVDV
jgi:SHS2 domain-containing protein